MKSLLLCFVASGCLIAAVASACGGGTSLTDHDAGSQGSGNGSSSSGSGSSSGSSSGSPSPSGLATFAFVVDGVTLTPMSCPAYNWEFPAPAAFQQFEGGSPNAYAVCSQMTPPCPGISSALIVNTGKVPVAYTAEPQWGGNYPPGVQFGDMMELSGVLNPGQQVDISSVWIGGTTVVLGASEPFSNMSHYASDEGTIPWPAGVAGSNGATIMYVAEINLVNSCHMPQIVW